MSKLNSLPTVPQIPTLLKSPSFAQNPLPHLTALTEQYGPTFQYFMGGIKKAIITSDPGFMQYVLQKNHKNYIKSEWQVKYVGRFAGKGLLTSNGTYWLQQRRLIQPGFHKKKLSDLVLIMQHEIDAFLKGMLYNGREHKTIDAHRLMMELAFKIVAKSLFSTSLADEELNKLRTVTKKLQAFVVKTIRQPYLNPWFKFSGHYTKHDQLAEYAKSMILSIVQQRKGHGDNPSDLLQMLLDAKYESTGLGMNDQQILDESMIIFVAGHETSANALAWSLYLLGSHPQYITKIRTELAREIDGFPITFDDLGKLKLTRAVIEETMRLYPPAWVTDREAIEADQFGDIAIPAGSLIVPFIFAAHRSPAFWDQAETFYPERFLDKKPAPFTFIPFGGGPRLCIGNNFALLEMQLILANLVNSFDLELVPDQNIQPVPLVTLQPHGGIQMTFKPREVPIIQ